MSKKNKKKDCNNVIELDETELQKKILDELEKDKEEHGDEYSRLDAAVAEAKRAEAEARAKRARARRGAERRAAHGEGEIVWVATRVGTRDNVLVTVPRSFVYRSFDEAWDDIRHFGERVSGLMTKVNPETNSGYSCRNGEFSTYWVIEEMDEDADPDKVVFRCRYNSEEPEFEFYLDWKFVSK